jgi:hypothetical protein
VAGLSRTTLASVAGGALLLLAAWLSPRAVPFNMDELVHYHALGCASAPLQREMPLVRDGCFDHDLRPPFASRPWPLRSYLYVGSFPSLPFLPFWLAFDDPVAARVQGAVFFLLFLALAARLLRLRASSIALAALVYPLLLATFLADEGPVGLSAVLLLGALLAVRRACGSSSRVRAAGWAALAGWLLFLGFWTKLVFAWWLPLVAAFALAEARGASSSWPDALRRHRSAGAALVLAFAIPAALLLASVDRQGRPYLLVVRQAKMAAEPERVQAAAGRLLPYLVDGARLAPRNVELPRSPLDPLPLVLAGALLALVSRRGAARRRASLAWGAGAAATFAFASTSAFSQWPHHFAFPLVPLVLALALAADGAGTRTRAVFAVLVAVYWVSLAARWPLARFPAESAPAKDELLRFVRAEGLDRDTVQLHASWGTYYVAQLFGDRERILFYMKAAPDDPQRLATVRDVALARGRRVLLLSARRWERVQTPQVEAALGPPLERFRFGDWWAALYDPSGGQILN